MLDAMLIYSYFRNFRPSPILVCKIYQLSKKNWRHIFFESNFHNDSKELYFMLLIRQKHGGEVLLQFTPYYIGITLKLLVG